MKRQGLLLLLCTLLTVQVFSETEFSKELFPTLAGLRQTVCTVYFDIPENEHVLELEGPEKDTIINDTPYLLWGSDQMFVSQKFALREEDGKIYIYSEPQKKDLVLYDFTLEEGDTLTTLNYLTAGYYEYNWVDGVVDYPLTEPYNDGIDTATITTTIDTLIVKDVSQITLLDGNEYKQWTFSNRMVYVEGIGEMGGDFFRLALHKVPIAMIYLGNELVCASQDGQLLYQMDQNEMDSLGVECLCPSIPNSVEDLQTPLPESTKYIHNNQLQIQHNDKTYNIMGMEVDN